MSMGNPNDQFGNFNSPQPKSGSGRTIMIVLLIIGVLCLVCCGGGAAFIYFGAKSAFNMVSTATIEAFKTHPAVQENIGEITSSQINLSATAEEQRVSKNQNVLVIDAQGTKGSGQFILDLEPGSQDVAQARLKLKDGRIIELEEVKLDFDFDQSNESTDATDPAN